MTNCFARAVTGASPAGPREKPWWIPAFSGWPHTEQTPFVGPSYSWLTCQRSLPGPDGWSPWPSGTGACAATEGTASRVGFPSVGKPGSGLMSESSAGEPEPWPWPSGDGPCEAVDPDVAVYPST